MKSLFNIILITFAVVIFTACSSNESIDELNSKNSEIVRDAIQKPRNVILLIGDGMGLQEASLSFYYSEEPVFASFKSIGLIQTSSYTHKITDSGAGNTAFSIGEKTYNGAIGVNADTLSIPGITEILADSFRIGILATSSITHATPAAFYAHVPDRDMEFEIARQLVHSPVDFFAGGGYRFFTERPDGHNLLDSLTKNGFVIDTNSIIENSSINADKKYGFLLNPEAMPPYNKRKDFLQVASKSAIQYFDKANEPFFLMIEGSQIDWAGHDNDLEYMIDEVLDFQECIRIAKKYAEEATNTLVIVTADHETGGFALSTDYSNNKDYNKLTPSFATGGHTASLVPVYAYGPGAEQFHGVYQNTDVFHKIMELLQ